ncbi:S8 family serine peptidase [Marinobacter sp. MMG032]|uniref:S8 family serine peptidase n=1 Tax=Marinobacter sp. MMG032 TaxID=3158548 RepID=A0AAU7MLK5_9GAMM
MRVVVPVLTAMCLVNAAYAAEPIKKIPVAAQNQDTEATAQVIVKYKEGVVTAQGASGPGGTRIFTVDADEADAFAARLRFRPEVEEVALDLIVRNPPMPSQPFKVPSSMRSAGVIPANAPTDPGFVNQISWEPPGEAKEGVQNLLAGYLASEQVRKLRVGVLDSGFYPVSDIDYAGGYNLSALGGDYGPEYLESEVDPSCTDPHGTAVAGIIGATTNNGVGIAGILDAELIATRVLSCGSGILSDTALGIRWLAGDPTVTQAPPLSEPVDIINASLGSPVSSCPFYLQDAIDYAHRKGILVVVAAGNESADASEYTPANCQNVIAVGSVNERGEPSDFSNHGDAVDLAALGELVATINLEGEVSRWYGTSFASPLVAGAAGLLKQANPALTPDELRNELVATSRPFPEPQTAGSAEDEPVEETPITLGAGIADSGKSVENVISQLDQLRPEIRPALDAIERCNREAYLANAPAGMDYSRLFEVTATNVELASEDEFYAIFRSTETGDKVLLKQARETRFLVRDVNPDREQLWFDVCDSEGRACRYGKSLPM